ncbi:MAG: polymer-forming cytoskeletal protein [Chloroflexi bacterium]|nr:polymer-forming cytoskeletal protein [Chloroflexota bacterium]
MGEHTQELKAALVVEGTIEGNVVSATGVLVRESGRIVGDVACPKVEISGQVDGSIRAEELILHEGAKVLGDILPWEPKTGAARGAAPAPANRAIERAETAARPERTPPDRSCGLQAPNLTPLRPRLEPVTSPPERSLGLGGPSVELTVGPFSRFSQLAEFLQALGGLAGVEKVETRQFYRGTVQLRVRYSNPIPLGTRLRDLASFEPHVSQTPSGLEVRLHVPAPTYDNELVRISEPVDGGPELQSSVS